jgi:hypothetical protein
MARSHDDGGEAREANKAPRRKEGRSVACEAGQRNKCKKRKRWSANAPPPPPAPAQEHRATSSADDGSDYARAVVAQRVREILAMDAKSLPAAELCKFICVYQRSAFI